MTLNWLYTVNNLMFVVSKFGNFKGLIYWLSLILVVSQLNVLYNV